jgi:hypothetical protein
MAKKKIPISDEALKAELLLEVNGRLAELNASHRELVNNSHALRNLLVGLGNSDTAKKFDLQMQFNAAQEEQQKIEARIASERAMLAKVNLIGTKGTLNSGAQLGQEIAGGALKAQVSKKQMKALPATAFKNRQIDLFRDLLANSDRERDALSNAIDLWDNVPRYAMSRSKQDKLRLEGGFLPLAELNFQYKGNPYTAQIRPARIETKNKDGELTGKTAEFYPSAREELVEHALRKLATEQQLGFLDTDTCRSGVTFTLHQLRTELAERGHAMKYAELVESLDIMNLSNIRLIDKGTNLKDPSLMSQPYLPTLVKVNKQGLASDPAAKWLVQFHSALTESIEQLTYRQFNYQRLMNCQSQLSRWLISQLVLKYTYASVGNTFTMLFSTIKRDSGLLDNYSRPRAAIEALDEAFDELKREGVLMSVKKDARIVARGKIEDVNYELATSVKFAAEQKAANKRHSNHATTLESVDNSA